VEAACLFTQHLLQKFDPKTHVTFEWSHDCSKPCVDAYGGGAAFITAKEIKSMSTAAWLNEQIACARPPAGGINQHLLGMGTGSGCKRLGPVPVPIRFITTRMGAISHGAKTTDGIGQPMRGQLTCLC
jgi:hypothetical protein